MQQRPGRVTLLSGDDTWKGETLARRLSGSFFGHNPPPAVPTATVVNFQTDAGMPSDQVNQKLTTGSLPSGLTSAVAEAGLSGKLEGETVSLQNVQTWSEKLFWRACLCATGHLGFEDDAGFCVRKGSVCERLEDAVAKGELPPWMWAVFILLLLLCCVASAWCYLHYYGHAGKRKREIFVSSEDDDSEEDEEEKPKERGLDFNKLADAPLLKESSASSFPAPMPSPSLAPGVVKARGYTVVQPMQVVEPMRQASYQSLKATTVTPMTMYTTQPVVSRVAPSRQYSAVGQPGAQPVGLFDALDVNHDGSLSREEFARLRLVPGEQIQAAVGVDVSGDGRADMIVAGADNNHDHIPDALQR
eukprot:TRINITY_DN26537_c0_g1_i8.p1 TRINITY_DN26537_c0_g1~~TRINITY_DN26537_c0_g1_i8.p1  ORF type:complete len:360 (+),score=63.67 TRINITY_DN26537_c0_g1_i8:726-1805(+)